jgi:hypothetical protein
MDMHRKFSEECMRSVQSVILTGNMWGNRFGIQGSLISYRHPCTPSIIQICNNNCPIRSRGLGTPEVLVFAPCPAQALL